MIPTKCDLCSTELPMVELHVCERGWLCDGCYYSNEPWMQGGDGYNPGNMEECR